jgi:tetratricopeptide (TPR) repeat protein/class 3 adenylate cyclase
LRTYEELLVEVRRASVINDIEALRSLSVELTGLGTPEALAQADRAIGSVYRLTSDYVRALEHYERALAAYEHSDDRENAAIVTNNIGIVYERMGDYSRALELLERALSLREEQGDKAGIASVVTNIALVHLATGDYARALEDCQRALVIHEELGDHAGIARVTSNIANVYLTTSDYARALDLYERALSTDEELGDRIGAAIITCNIGLVHWNIGNYERTMEQYERALSLYNEVGNRAGAAMVTGNLGVLFASTGDYPRALQHYQQALAVHEDLGDRAGVARVTHNLGNIYTKIGDYPRALEQFERASEILRDVKSLLGSATVMASIGNVYEATGDYPRALEQLERALSVYEELGDRANVARIIGNIGMVIASSGDYHGALTKLKRALEMSEELGIRISVAHCTIDMISVLIQGGQDQQAEEMLLKAEAMEVYDPIRRISMMTYRSQLQERRADLDGAYSSLHNALTLADESGLRSKAADCHQLLRDLSRKRNDFDGYIHHNTEYLRITEEIRGKEVTQRMAIMETQREIDAERREREVERQEREKERTLLYGTLPESVANRMLRGEDVSGDFYQSASVIFLDIVRFTELADRIPAGHVVHLLKQMFRALDEVCKRNGVTKIKTIGDSYMAVALPENGELEADDDHVKRAARTALEMLRTIQELEIDIPEELGDKSWVKDVGELNVRIGMHCGPLTAGVIGTERLQYDVWGDTVNVASRMESTGEAGRIHVSEAFNSALCLVPGALLQVPGALSLVPGMSGENLEHGTWNVVPRGETEVKGKGSMKTFLL